jgi:hypothetical protein
MRVNPKYSNVCGIRISMYRTEQCYSCRFLEECDRLYDEKTGDFDYPVQWRKPVTKRTNGKYKRTNKEEGQHLRQGRRR